MCLFLGHMMFLKAITISIKSTRSKMYLQMKIHLSLPLIRYGERLKALTLKAPGVICPVEDYSKSMFTWVKYSEGILYIVQVTIILRVFFSRYFLAFYLTFEYSSDDIAAMAFIVRISLAFSSSAFCSFFIRILRLAFLGLMKTNLNICRQSSTLVNLYGEKHWQCPLCRAYLPNQPLMKFREETPVPNITGGAVESI